jgi:DNA polymerase-3 subunit delta
MKAADYLFRLEKIGKVDLTRPILFLGEEEYWSSTGISLIKNLLFSKTEEEFNLVEIEVKTVEVSILGAELATAPFFENNRLLVLRGLEDLTTAQERVLRAGLSKLAPGVILILTARRLPEKFLKELKPLVETVECRPLKVHEAKRWVVQEGKALGLQLSPPQIDLLLEMKGTSLFVLKNELVKVKTYCGEEQKAVSMAEWGALLGEASATNVFQMIDGVIAGKTGVALNLLHRLLKAGEPELKILALLGTEVRRLFIAWTLQTAGRGHELQKELGCHAYVAEKTRKKAAALTYQQLRRAHQRILTADYRLKTSGFPPSLELEGVILDLSSALAKKSRP